MWNKYRKRACTRDDGSGGCRRLNRVRKCFASWRKLQECWHEAGAQSWRTPAPYWRPWREEDSSDEEETRGMSVSRGGTKSTKTPVASILSPLAAASLLTSDWPVLSILSISSYFSLDRWNRSRKFYLIEISLVLSLWFTWIFTRKRRINQIKAAYIYIFSYEKSLREIFWI